MAIDTAITECGSMNISHEFCSTDSDAPPLAASDAVLLWKTPAIWVTRIMPKVQPAAVPVRLSPTPRHPKSTRKVSPARFQKAARMSAWLATPKVAVPARRAMRGASHTSVVPFVDASP